MQLKKLKEEEVRHEAMGLADGGHVLLSCSDCRAILMDIWVTMPDAPNEWRLRANCPFCHDSSFVTRVRGNFHYGGYGATKGDDASEDVPSTIVDSMEMNDGVFVFNIKKANDHAKAIQAPGR